MSRHAPYAVVLDCVGGKEVVQHMDNLVLHDPKAPHLGIYVTIVGDSEWSYDVSDFPAPLILVHPLLSPYCSPNQLSRFGQAGPDRATRDWSSGLRQDRLNTVYDVYCHTFHRQYCDALTHRNRT